MNKENATDASSGKTGCTVGVRVKTMRSELGISQAELARRSGLTPSAICLIEKEGRDIAVSSARKLAAALEVSIDYLAGTVIYPHTEMCLRIELGKLKQRMYEIIDIARSH